MLEEVSANATVDVLEFVDLVLGIWVDLGAEEQITFYGSELAKALAEVGIFIVDIASRLALNIST
ncbi:MAG TPA: hypothetical protein G4O13_04750 [Dehalococcoidia bacterium]|nr:hypothetical protein [Dehalococcoidia bacterium]